MGKSRNWDLDKRQHPIDIKFDIITHIRTLQKIYDNYSYRGPVISHLDEFRKLVLWQHQASDLHQILYLGLYIKSILKFLIIIEIGQQSTVPPIWFKSGKWHCVNIKTSDSRQIQYLSLNTNYKLKFQI